MVYVFEDGRIFYIMPQEGADPYVTAEVLPEIPEVEGMIGYVAADIAVNKVVVKYMPLVPEPMPPEPTDVEILQAEILLNQIVMIENQQAQDMVLAEILLGQLGV